MADYPTILQAIGTEARGADGTVVDRAVSGKPRLRTYFTQTWYEVKVVHDLDDTDMDTLNAHYAADKYNAFAFTFKGDDTIYTCRYGAKPRAKPIKGSRWLVTVRLIVV